MNRPFYWYELKQTLANLEQQCRSHGVPLNDETTIRVECSNTAGESARYNTKRNELVIFEQRER